MISGRKYEDLSIAFRVLSCVYMYFVAELRVALRCQS